MKHIGPILKAARERKQASLRDLARRSGISAGTLSRLENGKFHNPSFMTITTVSEAYGIAPALWFAKIVNPKTFRDATGELVIPHATTEWIK